MQVTGEVRYRVSHGDVVEPWLAKAAHEFEAQMMKELIRPMTRSDEEDDASGSGEALTDFAGEALGQSLSRAGGFGIAERIIANLSQMEPRSKTDSIPEQSKDLTAKH